MKRQSIGSSLERVLLRDLSFFQYLEVSFWRIFTNNYYDYPVVYSDGIISFDKVDSKGRTPIGIVIDDYIILLEETENAIPKKDIDSYLKGIKLAGHQASLPKFELLQAIKSDLKSINALITELGGVPFGAGFYYTCSIMRNVNHLQQVVCTDKFIEEDILMLHFGEYVSSVKKYYTASETATGFVRPIISIGNCLL